MTLYYHNDRQLFSDAAPLADRRRFAVWDGRDDPQAAYTAHGWTAVTEAAPTYSNEPLTGAKVRVYLGNGEWQWQVDGRPWSECVDELEHARRQCRAALDAMVEASRSSGLPTYKLPIGGTLNGTVATGQTVTLYLYHPLLGSNYWVDFAAMVERRGPRTVEEFDSVEGRVTVPGTSINVVFGIVADEASNRRTYWLRQETAYRLASTAEDFDTLRAEIEGN
ncbi:MAG: hypothetical protein Fues2KO_45630 [Fuerstiella sp.]